MSDQMRPVSMKAAAVFESLEIATEWLLVRWTGIPIKPQTDSQDLGRLRVHCHE